MIEIDGRNGEGGGQILRSALSLSMLTGEPFRMHHIRAGRSKPGLLRQHLTCVNASAEVCGASVDGAALRSKEIVFRPGLPTTGEFKFAIGTAGSTSLVLQTILPALQRADGDANVEIRGGTHNPHAPSFEFLDGVFVPALRQMGLRAPTLELPHFGFFPAGGGVLRASLTGSTIAARFERLEPVELESAKVVAILANLRRDVGVREVERVLAAMNWPSEFGEIRHVDSPGPGNALLVELVLSNGARESLFAVGQKGVSAEHVADQVISDVKDFLALKVSVGPHLADQLLLPMVLSEQGGAFFTGPPSRHTLTQIETIRLFKPEVDLRAQRVGEARIWRIEVSV